MTATVPSRGPVNRRLLGVLAVGLLLLVGGGAVTLLSSRNDAQGPPDLVPPAANDPLRSEIEAQNSVILARPEDAESWATLAVLNVESARLGGDPSAYLRAERAVAEALRLAPANAQARRSEAVLANARHDFAAGFVAAQAAVSQEPRLAPLYGPLVDSLIELGRYDEAATAVQTMIDLRPDLGSYARVAYVRELRGDLAGAVEAMEAARRSSSRPTDVAFARFQLGELAWHQGRLDEAAAAYQDAARLDPRSFEPPSGQAKVLAAKDDLGAAIELLEPVVARAPLPGLVVQLAELKRAAGDGPGTTRLEELLQAQRRLFQANGVTLDLELAVHGADTRTDLDSGLRQAQAAYRAAPSIFAADALGWQLHAAGRHTEALRYADEALRLRTPRASFHWHRAEIRRALGQAADAEDDLRAVARLNPRFSPLFAGEIQRSISAITA